MSRAAVLGMHIPQPLLGYDARELWIPPERGFLGLPGSNYLLRERLTKVLSADVLVWPTIFRTSRTEVLNLEDIGIGATGADRPAFVGPLGDIWEDLGVLREHAARFALDRPDLAYDIVALSSTISHLFVGRSVIPPPQGEWELLGYDVVDWMMISGLTNCEYTSEEIAALGGVWGPRLNSSHLFDELEIAERFCQVTSVRVPEHAPFAAVGLWRMLS